MKRLAVAAIAALTFAAPLAVSTTAAADPPGHHHNDRRGYNDGYREGRHDQRRHDRWDDRRYNGYTYNGRWYYGPPPSAYYGRSGFEMDYRSWRRGDRLPSYYGTRYVVVTDYHRAHLRPPPRGYHYVRDDRGDYLLVGIATGIILGVILGS